MGRTGEHAPQSFTGFDRLADRAVAWLAERRRAAREREAARRAENPPPLFPRKRWDAMPPERRAELWAVHDAATEMALGSPSIMTYGAAAVRVGGNLSRMGALVERGASNATIRRLTRYEKGPFGYGVETGSAFLKPSAYMKSYTGPSVGRLSEVADVSDGVVKAYPDIGEVAVEIVPDSAWTERIAAARRASAVAGDGKVGAYAPAQDLILVRGPMPSEAGSMAMTSERMDRTLVHEMQHAAQARDGILGKAAGDYRTAAKEVDARNSANRRWLGPAERREMPRANTQDVRPEEVHMDDKGGEDINGRHGNFTNFLATDDVPESIFGIPVVQDEGGYTEKDLAFFKENPKAAGFYEMGDEEDVESQEAWGGADTLDDVYKMTAGWARESDGRPRLVRGRDAGRPVAELRPRGGYAAPTGIASALGAQVDPSGEAKRAYLATARGEVSDPLVEELGLPSGTAYAPLVALGAIQAAEAFGGKGKPGKAAKPGRQGLSVEAPRVDWATMEAARQRYRNDPAMSRAPDYLKYTLFINESLGAKNASAKSPRGVPLMNGFKIPILNDPELVSRTLSTISDDAVRGVDAFWRAGVRKLSAPRMVDWRTGAPILDDYGNITLDPAVRQAFDRGYYIPGSLYSYNVPGRISNHFPFARPIVPIVGESSTYYVDGTHDVGPVAQQPPGFIGRRGSFELDVTPGAGQGVQMWWHGDSGRITLPNMYFGGRMLGSDPREFGGDPGLGPVDVTYPPGTRRADGAGKTVKDVHGLVQKFKDHVRTYENRRVKPYRDVDGNWAVGYGSHYLADGTKVTPKTAVTDRMIDDAFDADLARRVDLLAGHDRRQARFAVPNWRYMSPESRLMLLDVSWGRKDTLTEKKSPGLFGELRAAGRDTAALDDAVRRHYPSYRKATDANGAVDESKTAGLQNRRIALLKALTGEDFSYDGKKWSTEKNKFVEE